MSVFHVKRPTPKHVENSIRGIRRAKRLGYTEIDLDMLITKDGVIVGCHWPRPLAKDGFRDPLKRIDRHALVRDLTWPQVARLRARTRLRTYRIQRIERLLKECARAGIGAVLEPKGDPRFKQAATWDHIGRVADDVGAHVRVYGFDLGALTAAKAAGFKARELR